MTQAEQPVASSTVIATGKSCQHKRQRKWRSTGMHSPAITASGRGIHRAGTGCATSVRSLPNALSTFHAAAEALQVARRPGIGAIVSHRSHSSECLLCTKKRRSPDGMDQQTTPRSKNTPANFRRKSVLETLTVADRSRENRGYAIISDSGENRSRIGENRGLATLETEGPSCENTFDDPVLTCPAAEKQVPQ